MIQAAANVAKALKGRGADVGITMIARSVNSMGLGIMGGGSLDDALTELETGRADAVVVLENDLHRHASATRVNAALAKAPLVMVVDHQRTAIMENAHWCFLRQALQKAMVRSSTTKAGLSVSSVFTIRRTTTATPLCWKAGAGCIRCTAPCKTAK